MQEPEERKAFRQECEAKALEWRERLEEKYAHLLGEYTGVYAPLGWLPLVESYLAIADHAYSRWQENVKLRESMIEDGYDLTQQPYTWVNAYFEKYPENPMQDFEITTIKSKLGSLRIYTMNGTDRLDGAVLMAEQASRRMCEWCGKPGSRAHRRSWMFVACNTCRELMGLTAPPKPEETS